MKYMPAASADKPEALTYIVFLKEHKWRCLACNLVFTLYGPSSSFLVPNYCPNCGQKHYEGEPSPFVKPALAGEQDVKHE